MAEVVRSVKGDGGKISRREIQEVIAKAVELRALHAALMQGNNQNHNPSPVKFLSASPPLSRPSSHVSAHDYPVFTPTYEDEPLPISGHIRMASQLILENWDDNNKRRENQTELHEDASSRKGLADHHHICPMDDTISVVSSSTDHVAFQQATSPGAEMVKWKRRTRLDDSKSVSSCNKCMPATITTDHSKTGMPLSDCQSVNNASQNKSRGMILSWLFPRSKRSQKNEGSSPVRAESEDVSQVLNDLGSGMVSIETLKKELIESNKKRDAAVREVSEMKSSFEELKKKLQYLESHCEELKKALLSLSKGEKLGGGNLGDSLMPFSEDITVEGFLQIVAEARLSMKQFCKTLFRQIDDKDEQLRKNINQLLKPYKLSYNSKHPKPVFYHLAAVINQAFYQDFENCVFEKNGTPKSLDPLQERQQKFQSFVALRNLSWNEVLKKGTKYYSEKFSHFCDQKMNCIVVTLNWTRQWPEPLLQSFFVAAKCVWLLHLLAFSFHPPLMILRVEENRPFDSHYMEDVFKDKQKWEGPTQVKVMVMPGFYVQDRILRCKVLCRYKSTA